MLDFWRKWKYLFTVDILGIDQGGPGLYNKFDLWLPLETCKFLPISFILFHLLRIMFTYNNTVRIYWEILGAVINVISFTCRGGFYCVALHWHPIRAFYYLSSFVFKLNTFSLFFSPLSSKWLFAWRFAFKWMWREHWQHLANLVKAAQYLSLQTWMGKKTQWMFCRESPQVTAV